jgi:hypothetical protein
MIQTMLDELSCPQSWSQFTQTFDAFLAVPILLVHFSGVIDAGMRKRLRQQAGRSQEPT